MNAQPEPSAAGVSPDQQSSTPLSEIPASNGREPGGRLWPLALVGVLLALLLYYPVGAWRANVIDDDPTFTVPILLSGQSQAAALGAGLLKREIDKHGWAPNKPFFMPISILQRMPNFQKGVAAGVARFALELDEVIGRSPDPSVADADLDRAAGLLQYPPDVWMIDPSVPWAQTLSTEKQYRNAARSLEAYNQRLATGNAAFVKTPEALRETLLRFARDLDEVAASMDAPLADSWAISWTAAAPYYVAKGRVYALSVILRGLGEDYADVLVDHNLTTAWQMLLRDMQAAAAPRPFYIMNGAPDALLLPNHMMNQGYQILRARARLTAAAESLR